MPVYQNALPRPGQSGSRAEERGSTWATSTSWRPDRRGG